CEILAGAADLYGPSTCTPDGIPDTCQSQPDCDIDGLPDRCELAGTDCAPPQYPDDCPPDCDKDGQADACEILAGAADRYGVNTCAPDGIPDVCQPQPDCDGDGLPNSCELAGNDCDNNQFPDNCHPDCDNDGQANACEILAGAADRYGRTTCTPDGVPDVCQPQDDCDADGLPNRCELAGNDCDNNQFPDNCQPDCDGDGQADACELLAGAADRYGPTTCTPDGIPDVCQPQNDCDNDGLPDRCELAGNDCDNNQYPDDCQPDCDKDGQADACEILAGAADRYGRTTCTPDGVPDVCQPQVDCNSSGLPDRCELAGNDCDNNQILDECQPDCDKDGQADACEILAGGADRYGPTTCTPDGIPDSCQSQPDCDFDGLPDRCEILAGAPDAYGVAGGVITCTPNGVPDSCEPAPDCDGDGLPDFCEILAGAADRYGKTGPSQIVCTPDGVPDACQPAADCDTDGLPDRCEIVGGAADNYGTGPNGRITCSPDRIPDICQPAPDCDADGFPDACELAGGASDCNANGLPDSCEPDCNADGTIDACEADCNSDGTPDECQTLVDCNANGVPDQCELAGGAGDCDGDGLLDACEVDCDANGVPDQCEIAAAPYLDADLDGQLDSCTCLPRDRGAPGSLLVYPHFDNRAPSRTLFTVTNIDTQRAIDVHFVFIDAETCLEANFTRRLTPRDTLSFLTSAMNPNMVEGWCFAYAQDPATGAAAKHDFLVGRLSRVDGVAQVDYDLNAVVFRAVAGPATDVDGDGLRDLDGVEYEEAPDEILIPRFFAQDEQFSSELLLLALGGGGSFTNIVDLRVYNDNEEIFSLQTQFTCWRKSRLVDLSPLFTRDYLSTRTNSDPNETRHAPGVETGWMSLDGRVASSGSTRIVDPAIYAVLVESTPGRVIADLPWERCSQANGVLLPVGTTGQ
ncbi:MAG: hypothetical protein RIR65_831, partial [Planctomycetota bacterium]